MAKNLRGKTVKRENAYEVWENARAGWTWYILKFYAADDHAPYARAFCDVVTPICPEGELGDVYLSDIRDYAIRVK